MRSTSMNLARSTEIDEPEYERFLDAFAVQPGTALAYHYPFYLRFLRDVAYPGSVVRFITARDAGGRLIGVAPGLHVSTARMNVWLSLAYFGPNAGALVAASGTAEGAAIVRALVGEAQADARDRGCGSMTIYTPLGAAAEPYLEALGGADFDVARVAQCVRLPDDAARSPWPRKVRYYSRRATSLGVTVRKIANEQELEGVWDLYRERCERQSIPVKPLEHVRALYRTAGPRGLFLVAERHGEVIAALICFLGGGVMSYYLPVARADTGGLRPVLLLIDAAGEVGRAAGSRLFNFEASPDVGDPVYRFKAECGGQPVPYRVFVKLLRPSVLDEYRALTATGVAAEAPHAFVVPFEALAATR
jgi:Acetyltransferase (GNAT) domain